MSSTAKLGDHDSPAKSTIASTESAGPLRRLGALVYDTLLVAALLMVVTALFLLITRAPVTSASGWLLYVYRVILLTVAGSFFVYFWTAKGRTLGMQAWRIRVVRTDGGLPTLRDALLRLTLATIPWVPGVVLAMVAAQPNTPRVLATVAYWLFALVPLNYLSAWIDVQRRSWHDRFLQTRIVRQK
jgi:uncharacterized RDD family membrane protein YckC